MQDELGAAVIHESGAAYQQLFELVADESNDIAEAIGAFFGGAANALQESDYIDICPIGNVAREVASTHEPLRHATVVVFAGWTTAISTRLRAAGTMWESVRDAGARVGDLRSHVPRGIRRSVDDSETPDRRHRHSGGRSGCFGRLG